MIPKADIPTSFEQSRPIYLCNFIYKLLAKIITNTIKSILSKVVCGEQFAFLEKRKILDAIGISQEFLDFVKIKNLNAVNLENGSF